MYRCHACDTPAQYNCACFTQTERPDNVVGHENEPWWPEETAALINIASGEDAGLPLEFA